MRVGHRERFPSALVSVADLQRLMSVEIVMDLALIMNVGMDL